MKNIERSKFKKNIEKKEIVQYAGSEKIHMSLSVNSQIEEGLLMQRLTELYDNPIEASVREVVSNAVDATSSLGNLGRIEIFKPSRLNPVFIVKDNGCGMTKETLLEIYSKYGSSTKRSDLNQIGSYGLGAKSPLAYTTHFTVDSVKDGLSTVLVVSKGEHTNYLEIISQTPTDRESGTTVSIPVCVDDLDEFSKAVDVYLSSPDDFKQKMIIDGVEKKNNSWNLFSEVEISENDSVRVWINEDLSKEIVSNVNYAKDKLDKELDEASFVIGGWLYDKFEYFGSRIVVELLPGVVSFNSSRDSILKDSKFNNFISKIKSEITSDVKISSFVKNRLESFDSKDFFVSLKSILEDNSYFYESDGVFEFGAYSEIFKMKDKKTGVSFLDIIEKTKELNSKVMLFGVEATRLNTLFEIGFSKRNFVFPSLKSNPKTTSNVKETNKVNKDCWMTENKKGYLPMLMLNNIIQSMDSSNGRNVIVTDVPKKEEGYEFLLDLQYNSDCIFSSYSKKKKDGKKEICFTLIQNKEKDLDFFSSLFDFEFISYGEIKEFIKKYGKERNRKSSEEKDINDLVISIVDEDKFSIVNEEGIKKDNREKIFILIDSSSGTLKDFSGYKKYICNSQNKEKEKIALYAVKLPIVASQIEELSKYGKIFKSHENMNIRKSSATRLIEKGLLEKDNLYKEERENKLINLILLMNFTIPLDLYELIDLFAEELKKSNSLTSNKELNFAKENIEKIRNFNSLVKKLNIYTSLETEEQKKDTVNKSKHLNVDSLNFVSLVLSNQYCETYNKFTGSSFVSEKIPEGLTPLSEFKNLTRKSLETKDVFSEIRNSNIIATIKVYKKTVEEFNKLFNSVGF